MNDFHSAMDEDHLADYYRDLAKHGEGPWANKDLEDAKAAIAALDPRRVRNLIEAARRWRREWSAPGWGNPDAQQVAKIHLERSIDALGMEEKA